MVIRRKGTALSASTLFGEWYVAAALGLVLGVALTLVSLRASRLMKPEDPSMGFAMVAFFMMVRLGVVIAALLAYFVGAPDGFLVFGVALICSFIASIGLEAVKLMRSSTSS